MREQALLTRRAVATRLPLAALLPATAAAPHPADADAALLDVGRRWQAACAALHENDKATVAVGDDDTSAISGLETEGDRLFAVEMALFDELMAMRPRSLKGLVIKAQALARAHDVLSSARADLEAAAASTFDLEASSALIIALDIANMAESAS